MIICVAAQKGGVGKTTLATNLAIQRALNNKDVLLVDADLQASSLIFNQVRDEQGHSPSITCVQLTGDSVMKEVRKLAPKYDDTIIDVGGKITDTMQYALTVADVVLVPITPSAYDLWNAEEFLAVLPRHIPPFNENVRLLAVLNRVDTNPKIGFNEDVQSRLMEIEGIKLVSVMVGNRVAIRRAAADGQAVVELEKDDTKAVQEMKALYEEVFNG